MRVISLFSGAGGIDIGMENAGHEIIAMCEIDPIAREVLHHRWPDVPIHTDVTTLDGSQYRGRVDIVSGGSPCQDLSVAGRRAGLDGTRSSLFWHQCRIARESDAAWILWENVPGALSSNDGEDFASVLWGLTGYRPAVPEDGWRSTGVCYGDEYAAVWRLLDAQYFGVPQRRRRVFVVRGPRAICGPEILIDRESSPWDPAPVRSQRSHAPTATASGSGGGLSDSTRDRRVDSDIIDGQLAVAGTLLARDWKGIGQDSDTRLVIEHPEPVPFVKTRRAQTSSDDEGWESERPAPTITGFDQGDTRTTVAVVEPRYEIVHEALPDVASPLMAEDGRLQMTDDQSIKSNRHIVMRRVDDAEPDDHRVIMEFMRRDDVPRPADVAPTLTARMGNSPQNVPLIAPARVFATSTDGDHLPPSPDSEMSTDD